MLFTYCNIILNEDVRGKLTQNSQQIKIQLNEFFYEAISIFLFYMAFYISGCNGYAFNIKVLLKNKEDRK